MRSMRTASSRIESRSSVSPPARPMRLLATSANAMMAPRGFPTSWAIPAASVPTDASRAAWTTWSRASTSSWLVRSRDATFSASCSWSAMRRSAIAFTLWPSWSSSSARTRPRGGGSPPRRCDGRPRPAVPWARRASVSGKRPPNTKRTPRSAPTSTTMKSTPSAGDLSTGNRTARPRPATRTAPAKRTPNTRSRLPPQRGGCAQPILSTGGWILAPARVDGRCNRSRPGDTRRRKTGSKWMSGKPRTRRGAPRLPCRCRVSGCMSRARHGGGRHRRRAAVEDGARVEGNGRVRRRRRPPRLGGLADGDVHALAVGRSPGP